MEQAVRDLKSVSEVRRGWVYAAAMACCWVLFVSLLAVSIDAPWQHRNDENGALLTCFARSRLDAGLRATKWQDFFLSRSTHRLEPYLHHPPLAGSYLAAVFAIAGDSSPFVARFATAVAHAGSFVLVLRIVAALFPARKAIRLWTAFVFAVTPMSVFYGKMPNHEALSLFFLLVGVWVHLGRLTLPGSSRLWTLLSSAAWGMAVLTSWHSVFVAVGFLLVDGLRSDRPSRSGSITGTCCVVAAVLFDVIHIWWANGWRPLDGQRSSMVYWVTPEEGHNFIVSFLLSLFQTFRHGAEYCGVLPWLFSGGWFAWALFQRRSRKWSSAEVSLLAMFIGSLGYQLFLFRAAAVHPYQQFYLLPFVAVSSGVVMAGWIARLRSGNRTRLVPLVVVLCVLLTGASSTARLTKLYSVPYGHTLREVESIQREYVH